MEETEKTEEKDELGKPPETEVKVWGLGLTNNKLDKLIELQDRSNFLASMTEKKIARIIELLEVERKV